MGAAKVRRPKVAKRSKWTPPTPTIEKAHDVRRLSVCEKCGRLGADLLRLRNLFAGRKAYAHAYCLIVGQRDGWEVFARLPSEEIGKITMSEWKALRIPYSRVERAYEDALNREHRAALSSHDKETGR